MHELAIARSVLATVEQHAAGRRVGVVSVQVGALRQVVPESLRFSFEAVSRGTVCEGARLELSLVRAVMRCSACGNEWELAEPMFRCPRCSAPTADVVRGEELRIESIEVEEEACTARA